MSRQTVETNRSARAVGPFSAGVKTGGFIFLSGQIALDPASGKLIAGDVGAQTEQIFRNIGAVSKRRASPFLDLVKPAVFLPEMKHCAEMNAVSARHFKPPYPARTTIAVAGLPMG